MEKERILITVKTYPTLSRSYGETVCTAGVREDGSWVRIYPVPFRRLEQEDQYKKFDWVECGLVRGAKDPRPETRHPQDLAQMRPVGHMQQFHFVAPNPWVVIGVLPIPHETQLGLPFGGA